MALRFCRASVDTPYVLLSTPLKRKLLLSERTYVPRPCEGSKTLDTTPRRLRPPAWHPSGTAVGVVRINLKTAPLRSQKSHFIFGG